jgi:general secretion pathway protein F
MASYAYRALDTSGKEKHGEVEAASIEAALRKLQASGLLAFECADAGSKKELPWWRRDISFGHSISRPALTNFTRELSTLVNAQLTIDESIRLIGQQDRAARELCQYLGSGIRSGSSLSSLVETYKGGFPAYYAPMVRAGEMSGKLGQVLDELTQLLERSRDITSRIRAALIYPIVLLLMSAAMMTVVIAILVPSLLPLFEGSSAQLPILLQVFTSLNTALESYWHLLLGAMLAIAVASYALWRRKGFREAAHACFLKLPLIGRIILLAQISRIARVLATLLRGGVPLPNALRIAQTVATNLYVGHALTKVETGVREGTALSTIMAMPPFPDRLVQLIRVGERAGRLEEMLQHSAAIMEQELQERIERSVSLITPLMTLILGLSIGGLVMSVMDAILSVNEIAF